MKMNVNDFEHFTFPGQTCAEGKRVQGQQVRKSSYTVVSGDALFIASHQPF